MIIAALLTCIDNKLWNKNCIYHNTLLCLRGNHICICLAQVDVYKVEATVRYEREAQPGRHGGI